MTVIARRNRKQVIGLKNRKRHSLLATFLRRLLWIPGLLASKENSFAEHKNIAGDTRQGWCSAAGSDWANHKAEVRSIWPIRPMHLLRLTTTGREYEKLSHFFRVLQWNLLPHEPETRFVQRRIPRGTVDLFVDVGANFGMYAHIMAKRSRRVFAFEPGPERFKHLQDFYQSENCVVEPKAVHDADGQTVLKVPSLDGTAITDLATIAADNTFETSEHDEIREIKVKTVTIDSYFEAIEGRIDLLKIDVEGNEFAVLRGAAGRIATDRPVLLLEAELRHSDKVSDLFSMLERLGYRAARLSRQNRLVPVDFEELALLQSQDRLAVRKRNPLSRAYVNNFFFLHDNSRITPLLWAVRRQPIKHQKA